MVHDVFISHSSQDKVVADAVVASLERSDIRCWYAPRDIPPGGDWAEEIASAIKEASVFLLIFSEHANRSQRVLDELNLAISQEVVILPFRIENLYPIGAMELHLSARHWLDAFEPSWQDHLDQLTTAVSAILDENTKKIAPPFTTKIPKPAQIKKKHPWLFPVLGVGAIIILALIYFLPGLLNSFGFSLSSEKVTPTTTVMPPAEDQPTATTIPAPTITPIGSSENPIILIYLPYEAADFNTISSSADEITQYFSQNNNGLVLKIIPASSAYSLKNALCNGDAHIGVLDTFAYLQMTQDNCQVEAQLIWSAYEDIKYGGEFITQSSSEEINELQDLEGKVLCIPNFDSVSGWVIPSLEIKSEYGDPFSFFSEVRELGGHNLVVEDVYYRRCDAGSVFYDAREIMTELPNVMEQVKIIHRTLAMPTNNITFTKDLDQGIIETIKASFISQSKENSHLALLSGYTEEAGERRLIEINDTYYNDLRDLFDRAGEDVQDY